MDRVTAMPAGELRLDQRVFNILPLPGQRWLVQCSDAGELLVVDAQLQPLWRLSVPAGWRGTHAVADDLSLVALSLRDHVRLVDHTGQQLARFAHPPWGNAGSELGCCSFAADRRHLWATVPTSLSQHERTGSDDELWLIDLTALTVVDHRRLEVAAAVSTPLRHPDGQTVGLSIGEGQDGTYIRWAHAVHDRIALRTGPDDDRGLADIHPTGGEYLTTPHSQGEDELCRHRFSDDQVIDRLPTPPASLLDDQWEWASWDYPAGYLTEDLILAGTIPSERQVLIERDPLRLLATITYPSSHTPDEWFTTGHGAWLTVGDQAIRRWRLP